MFARAGALAMASRIKREQEGKSEFNDSDDENYVVPEKRNYLCILLVELLSIYFFKKTGTG